MIDFQCSRIITAPNSFPGIIQIACFVLLGPKVPEPYVPNELPSPFCPESLGLAERITCKYPQFTNSAWQKPVGGYQY